MNTDKKNKQDPAISSDETIIPQEDSNLTGYPFTPPSEDIYNKEKEEQDIDPEDTEAVKEPNEEPGLQNEKDFEEDESGGDLDVPGSELDDAEEAIGSEDEENNYYSVGGDNHNDLDEDRGD
jgi:hypothetical protein